jgi:hypothetical protein
LPFGEKFYACSISQPAHIELTQQNPKNKLYKLQDIVMIVLYEGLINPTIPSNIISGDGQTHGIGVVVSFIRERGLRVVFLRRAPSESRKGEALPRPFAEAAPENDGPLTSLAFISFSLWGGRSERTRVLDNSLADEKRAFKIPIHPICLIKLIKLIKLGDML